MGGRAVCCLVTKIIVCKLGENMLFGDGIKAMINIWSDDYMYVLMTNGILYHLILMAITNKGSMLLY